MKDHLPLVIDEFNGLWRRGTEDSCPIDHFPDCNNIQYVEGGFRSRNGINPFVAIPNPIKFYVYRKVTSEALLVLDSSGNLYDSEFPTVPILTIGGMLDIGFTTFAGRAYISPSTLVHGMAGEFVYVYSGDGTPARKAAGLPPTDADGALAAANSGSSGNVEAGERVYGVVYETDTGFLTQIGPDTLPVLTSPGGEEVDLTNIPVSPNSYVVKRHIVATRAIVGYNGDTRGYQFYFVPDGTINDNSTTTLSISFFDSDLLDDASYLLDVLSEIPAGVGLNFYNGRMIDYTQEPDDEQSTILVSKAGEPEVFDAIDGIILLPRDWQPITVCAPLRGVLYAFKNTQTWAIIDNGNVPSSWSVEQVDAGLGASAHGVATVLEGAGPTDESLLITNFSGIYLFNGRFNYPEISWKIADKWTEELDFHAGGSTLNIAMYNNTVLKEFYVIFPNLTSLLYCDYSNGLNPKGVRYSIWIFDFQISCIGLVSSIAGAGISDTLAIASIGEV